MSRLFSVFLRIVFSFAFFFLLATSNCLAQETSQINKLKEYNELLKKGEINEIEYYQLKNEYYKQKFNLNQLKSENRELYKAQTQIIAGSLLLPAGLIVGAGGWMYRNKPVPTVASSDEYNQRITHSKTTSTIIMAAGGVTSAVGIVLLCIGKTQKKKIQLKDGMAHLDLGILDNGNFGAALKF